MAIDYAKQLEIAEKRLEQLFNLPFSPENYDLMLKQYEGITHLRALIAPTSNKVHDMTIVKTEPKTLPTSEFGQAIDGIDYVSAIIAVDEFMDIMRGLYPQQYQTLIGNLYKLKK